jgi:hypothetical protein
LKEQLKCLGCGQQRPERHAVAVTQPDEALLVELGRQRLGLVLVDAQSMSARVFAGPPSGGKEARAGSSAASCALLPA